MGTARRSSLWLRIAALGVAIAVVTGALAGALAIGLIQSTQDRDARRLLGRLADAAQTSALRGRLELTEQGVLRRRVLRVLHIRLGEVSAGGVIRTDSPIVRAAVTSIDLAELRAGHDVSASRTAGGTRLYLEGRSLPGGAIVLVESRSDALAGSNRAIRRTVLAILVGVGVSALLGVLVARRITRPLRRTAQAALELAAGRRDVAVPPGGPVEVAAVGAAVNTLAAALSHSEARQREFLMSVSHELRTPLTAITGYAESLADAVIAPEQLPQVGAIMLSEAHRLERLVGDLLDLARLDAQDFRLDLGPVDLTELAAAAASVWDNRCRAVGVEFRLQSGPSTAWTDANRVRQVVDGLMENALRVTPAGAPIVLAVRTEADGLACAEVRDGGPGLTADDLQVAFDRSALYQRYRGVRQVGTGLGLAIVHGLVTRLGGSVEAGHASEGGARFTVHLPPVR